MKNTSLFTLLAIIFTTCLITANIVAGKLISLPFGITLTAGVIVFPITYIFGDVIPEVYGLKLARQVIWLGFLANAIAVFFFEITLLLASPAFWQGQTAFETVLGFTPRLLAASFAAYLVGTNVNAWVLVKIKQWTGSKYLWVRTISSTIFGESVDSLIFMTLAFSFVVPWAVLPGMIIAQAIFKTLYEVVATPLTYLAVNFCKRLEGIEQYAVKASSTVPEPQGLG